MVQLTPHDSSVLSRLVQFRRLSKERRQEIWSELESPDAKKVGEVVLDPERYHTSPQAVRDTVDRFKQWFEANQKAGRQRAVRRRAGRSQ